MIKCSQEQNYSLFISVTLLVINAKNANIQVVGLGTMCRSKCSLPCLLGKLGVRKKLTVKYSEVASVEV